MSTNYHTPITTGAPANANTFNTPLGDLDAQVKTEHDRITSEATTRSAAVSAEAAARAAAVSAEAVTRAAADTALSGDISALESDITSIESNIDTVEDSIAALTVQGGGTAQTTANGTQASSTALVVTDGTAFVNGSYISYVTTGANLEFRQISSGGGTNTLTLSSAHGGVTSGAAVTQVSASEFLMRGNYDTPPARLDGIDKLPGASRLGVAASAATTSITSRIGLDGLGNHSGWVVIDPFTTECEIRKISSISGTTINLDRALTYSHAQDDPIIPIEDSIWNVKWFGAKGDASTDDTTAIQRAITDCGGNSSQGVVYLPPGGYVVSSAITITTNSTMILGAGRMSTKLIIDNAYSGNIFQTTASKSWLQMRGFTATAASAGNADNAVFYESQVFTLEGLFSDIHMARIGTIFKGIFGDCKWRDCKFVGISAYGVHLTGESDRLSFDNVDFEGEDETDWAIYCEEDSYTNEISLNQCKYETINAGLYRNAEVITDRQPAYSVDGKLPVVCESVGRYQGDMGNRPRYSIPANLSDVDLPNIVTDGDMGMINTAAWLTSNATATKYGDVRVEDGYMFSEKKNEKVLKVTDSGSGGGFVYQDIADDYSAYFFTCLYAIEATDPDTTVTVEILDITPGSAAGATGTELFSITLTGTDDYFARFKRLSGSIGSVTNGLRIRVKVNTASASVWLNEVVLCRNLVSRSGYTETTGTSATVSHTSTDDYYTGPNATKIIDNSAAATFQNTGTSTANVDSQYMYFIRAKIATNNAAKPLLRFYSRTVNSTDQFTTITGSVDGWFEIVFVAPRLTSTAAHHRFRIEGSGGDTFYIDAVAVVDLGSKYANLLNPTFHKLATGTGGQYKIIYGPQIDLSAANSSQLLYYPTEHYQLHKVELIYSQAVTAAQAAFVLIGTPSNSDYYVYYSVAASDPGLWGTTTIAPTAASGEGSTQGHYRSDIRAGTPIMVNWTQNASQDATVIPVLYLR